MSQAPQHEQISHPVPASPAEEPASQSGFWFITSCLVLPVVWGVVVHLVFRRLRRRRHSEETNDSVWPDYQI